MGEPPLTSHNLPTPPAGDNHLASVHKLAKNALQAAEHAEREASKLRGHANRVATHYKAELEAAHGTLFDG